MRCIGKYLETINSVFGACNKNDKMEGIIEPLEVKTIHFGFCRFNSNLFVFYVDGMKKLKTKWSQDTLATLKTMSPLSLKLTLEQICQGAVKTYAECFQMEYRMATPMMENTDFFEGFRAVVVDKYRNPKWDKLDITKVTAAEVGKFFEPLDEDQELILYPSVTASTHKKE
ncbi:hypothetical protein PsorP6_005168 [Peronosclerospora sorghi]|uniref:Uncharacterized protein n=1 Tax=Peronosclerospora sorghi TaxID=230839 RepID=A0ACC0W1S4_9STRA|nr:hypothetical protein PsorP6_005168 [Peronosclerospora sorghi]